MGVFGLNPAQKSHMASAKKKSDEKLSQNGDAGDVLSESHGGDILNNSAGDVLNESHGDMAAEVHNDMVDQSDGDMLNESDGDILDQPINDMPAELDGDMLSQSDKNKELEHLLETKEALENEIKADSELIGTLDLISRLTAYMERQKQEPKRETAEQN